jgi:GTP-binding protein
MAAKPTASDIRIARAEFAAGAAQRDQIPPPNHPEIAFAGRSNVGKSSLLNMLLARKSLARTSSTPGCTRQINFFDIAIAGGPEIAFVDLPGYGYAKVSKAEAKGWKDLLEGYLHRRPTLRAVVLLVDARRGLEQEEHDLVEFLAERPELAVVIAATKLDKLPRSQQKHRLTALAKDAGLSPKVVIGTSAATGQGRVELWERVLDSCIVVNGA